jgi:hypothetical protein
MSRMTATTRIRAPIELAWAFVSDPARTLAVGGDVEIRLVSGSFTEPGSRFVASRRSGGQWIDAVHEVVRVDPPTYLETRIVMRDIVACRASGWRRPARGRARSMATSQLTLAADCRTWCRGC